MRSRVLKGKQCESINSLGSKDTFLILTFACCIPIEFSSER